VCSTSRYSVVDLTVAIVGPINLSWFLLQTLCAVLQKPRQLKSTPKIKIAVTNKRIFSKWSRPQQKIKIKHKINLFSIGTRCTLRTNNTFEHISILPNWPARTTVKPSYIQCNNKSHSSSKKLNCLWWKSLPKNDGFRNARRARGFSILLLFRSTLFPTNTSPAWRETYKAYWYFLPIVCSLFMLQTSDD